MTKTTWLNIGQRLGIAALIAAGMIPIAASATTILRDEAGYKLQGDQVWFSSIGNHPHRDQVTKVKGIDTATFREITPCVGYRPCARQVVNFARDRKHVFHRGNVIPGADPDTFVLIDDTYAKDKAAVYAGVVRLTNRIANFRPLPNEVWATDGRHIFYGETRLEGEGFELNPQNHDYARTKTHVYHRGKALTADASTFQLVWAGTGVSKDKNNVYYNDVPIPAADPLTMTVVSAFLLKDKRAVYLQGKEVVGLDPLTLRTFPIGDTYMADRNAVYLGHKKIEGDGATFEVLQPAYTKDKNSVYYKDAVLAQADPLSFVATSMDRGCDKNYCFNGKVIECKSIRLTPWSAYVCLWAQR